jgi:hypothetical protein
LVAGKRLTNLTSLSRNGLSATGDTMSSLPTAGAAESNHTLGDLEEVLCLSIWKLLESEFC